MNRRELMRHASTLAMGVMMNQGLSTRGARRIQPEKIHARPEFNARGVRRIAFVVYDGMTALDFVGVYDPITRLKTMAFLPDLQWEICALSTKIRDVTGLSFAASKVGESLGTYDVVVVPGGFASRDLIHKKSFINWIKTSQPCELKVSVCTGALLFGAAGFLKDKRATTHRSALDDLKRFCRSVVEERIVDEGEVITAGGVTSSIDLGLYLCEKFGGSEAKERIRYQIEYRC